MVGAWKNSSTGRWQLFGSGKLLGAKCITWKIKSASNIDMSVPVGASSAHQSIGCVGRVLTGLAGNFRE